MSSDAALKRRVEERKYFLQIIDCVQFLARQGLPFRGHDTNKENFRQVMFVRCKDSPKLMKRLAESTTVVTEKSSAPKQYLHQDYENELLHIMSQHALRQLLERTFQSRFFAIMCDEDTDVGNKKRLSFCTRWVKNQ